MENEKKIRLLRADEIECRVNTVSEKGISLLLYKDARVDQNILDEVFGIFGWQRKHEMIGNDLFCTIVPIYISFIKILRIVEYVQ